MNQVITKQQFESTQKRSIPKLHQNIQSHINSMLPEEMDEFLIETKSYLAGSFVMQAVLGETWNDVDVDIWIPHVNSSKSLSRMNFLLASYGFIFTGYECHGDFKSGQSETRGFDTHILSDEYRVLSYRGACQHRDKFVKLIVMPVFRSFFEIIQAFDIIATQIYYDGRVINSYNYQSLADTNSKLIEFSEKAVEFQTSFDWLRTFLRVEFYMDRGFTMDRKSLDFAVSTLIYQFSLIDKDDVMTLLFSFGREFRHKSALEIDCEPASGGLKLSFEFGPFYTRMAFVFYPNPTIQSAGTESYKSLDDEDL